MSTWFFSFLGFLVGARVLVDFLGGALAGVGVGGISIGTCSPPSSWPGSILI
jgi:hypothetical protein